MKAISYLMLGVLTIVLGSAIFPIGSHANTQETTDDAPPMLVGLLAVGDFVSLRSSEGVYDIDLLSDGTVQRFNQLVDRLKEQIAAAKTEGELGDEDSQRKRIGMLEAEWYRMEAPLKVVQIGEDYVRLEPITQVPRHEKVSWIAIATTSIRQIKSTK